ncbi:hypothetical protein F5Y19DRAFT_118983 [Xylariaceae sp. FL1651]|nr:hypothetical protein F5Y19DRAFT_118983 [Xylariaceae sp. FL1651]
MADPFSESSAAFSATQITAGTADLLIGTWTYPCFHKFSWILDYHLPRTGHRAPGVHRCPKCTIEPTCLACMEPFDANVKESCPSCDLFFIESLLRGRREKLVALNIRVLDERADVCIRACLEVKKERFRKKWGGWMNVKSENEGDDGKE